MSEKETLNTRLNKFVTCLVDVMLAAVGAAENDGSFHDVISPFSALIPAGARGPGIPLRFAADSIHRRRGLRADDPIRSRFHCKGKPAVWKEPDGRGRSSPSSSNRGPGGILRRGAAPLLTGLKV